MTSIVQLRPPIVSRTASERDASETPILLQTCLDETFESPSRWISAVGSESKVAPESTSASVTVIERA